MPLQPARLLAALLPAIAVAAFFGGPAAAQFNPFLPRGGPQLAPGDFQIMNDTAAKLNDASGPKVGQGVIWQNPRTTAHGRVAITKLYSYQGMTCHALRYEVSPKGARSPSNYDVNWCKAPDGSWKIKS